MLNLKQILFFSLAMTSTIYSSAADVNGAGSSAAQPLYESWAKAYRAAGNDIVIYDPVGSSAGIAKIKAASTDFGASDVAMSQAESDKNNLICFPTSVSGVVPFVNIPGIKAGQLNLTGQVLANIFEGKIKNWNDSAIAALNSGKALPNLSIYVVARQDGSGTTYILSDYLSKVSSAWQSHLGTNLLIQWPIGINLVKGNDGVIAAVEKNIGAIGYVDFSYVVTNKLASIKLQNRNKQFVDPTYTTFTAALTNSDWKTYAAFDEMLTDKVGAESWPITAGTFVLIPKVASNPTKTIAVLKFFSWSFLHGDEIAKKVGYVRLTDPLQAKVFTIMMTIKDKNGQKLSWTAF